MEGERNHSSAGERPLTVFEDRYGAGAGRRLLVLFEQPCVTFAQIAAQFGVTRERVRQWHRELLPDAPRGHARQRLCRTLQQKRRLFADPLFRAFYRDARAHIGPSRVALVPARDGFRTRIVRLDGQTIALRAARPVMDVQRGATFPGTAGLRPGRTPRQESQVVAWKLSAADRADFIYYRLGNEGYLLVPRRVLPRGGATFATARPSALAAYLDTFAAALGATVEGATEAVAMRM